jgi:LPLT family lysophospholipid transporter-like MFS transporter
MLVAVGSYTYAASVNVTPVIAMLTLGFLVFLATFLVSLHLPVNLVNKQEE